MIKRDDIHITVLNDRATVFIADIDPADVVHPDLDPAVFHATLSSIEASIGNTLRVHTSHRCTIKDMVKGHIRVEGGWEKPGQAGIIRKIVDDELQRMVKLDKEASQWSFV